MKCYKQSPYLRHAGVHIENIWEVQIPEETWQRICRVAAERRLTYSWVTRYCVFRLIRKKRLRMFPAMEKLSMLEKQISRRAEKRHRHQLCLYGADEKLLRLAAMQLEITVSRLIRMALLWFLPRFECEPRLHAWRRSGGFYVAEREIGSCSAPIAVKMSRWRARLQQVIGYRRPRRLSGDETFWYGIKLIKALTCRTQMHRGRPTMLELWWSQYAAGDWFGWYQTF